jgi:hypothetical protein
MHQNEIYLSEERLERGTVGGQKQMHYQLCQGLQSARTSNAESLCGGFRSIQEM